MLGVVVDAYNKSVPINTEIEDKKTNLNLNNKIFCYIGSSHSQKGVYGGGRGVMQEPFDLDLEKSWKFGFLGRGGSILQLRIWT